MPPNYLFATANLNCCALLICFPFSAATKGPISPWYLFCQCVFPTFGVRCCRSFLQVSNRVLFWGISPNSWIWPVLCSKDVIKRHSFVPQGNLIHDLYIYKHIYVLCMYINIIQTIIADVISFETKLSKQASYSRNISWVNSSLIRYWAARTVWW